MRQLAAALVLAVSGCTADGPGPEPGPAPMRLLLDGDGIQPAGSPLRIDFGRAAAGTVSAVTKLLGTAPAATNDMRECDGGPMTEVRWPNGLSLSFRQDAFVGWHSTEDQGRPAATAAGLSPGAALPQAVSLQHTALGFRFEAGGGVSGLARENRVDVLWAGDSCSFRVP